MASKDVSSSSSTFAGSDRLCRCPRAQRADDSVQRCTDSTWIQHYNIMHNLYLTTYTHDAYSLLLFAHGHAICQGRTIYQRFFSSTCMSGRYTGIVSSPSGSLHRRQYSTALCYTLRFLFSLTRSSVEDGRRGARRKRPLARMWERGEY